MIHMGSFLFCHKHGKMNLFLDWDFQLDNYIAENVLCVWYCSFLWEKQFALVPRWHLSCHEWFLFIMKDVVYHYWGKQFMMNLNGNSILQCFRKWKCKMYIYHKLRSRGGTYNAFLFLHIVSWWTSSTANPLLNSPYFGITYNYPH